ncbi:MAG TPA: Zn-dependent hydrolase [Phycisphaerales bacterium]|nr:Zn-dependent hydrolase [Phycisphaerales bacterium]
MAVEVQWIGHASFRIAGAGTVIYVDPWKLRGEPHDADIVFISHGHHDHCSVADIAKVSKSDTSLIAPPDVVEKLHAANAVGPGENLTLKEVSIETVAAYNTDKPYHPRANEWCGAVFTLAGKRIYYAGDTDLVKEMRGLKDVDLALLPVGGTYTLDAVQAARACEVIAPKAAVPYHWGDVVGSRADADAFAQAAPCKVHVLTPGKTLRL